MTRYCSDRVRPDVLRKIMDIEDYSAFNLEIEHGPHLAMPHGALGDFLMDTAPYGKLSSFYQQTIVFNHYFIEKYTYRIYQQNRSSSSTTRSSTGSGGSGSNGTPLGDWSNAPGPARKTARFQRRCLTRWK